MISAVVVYLWSIRNTSECRSRSGEEQCIAMMIGAISEMMNSGGEVHLRRMNGEGGGKGVNDGNGDV